MNDQLEERDLFAWTLAQAEFRHTPMAGQLDNLKYDISMLHSDVLHMVYLMARDTVGDVLELGAYIGGATASASLGLQERNSGKVVTVEKGGSFTVPPHNIPDVLEFLKNNLAKYGVTETVKIISGLSFDNQVIERIKGQLKPSSVSLLIHDIATSLGDELERYGGLLAPGACLVVDDYSSLNDPDRVELTQASIRELSERGVVESWGVFGWGTWFGKLRDISRL